MPIPNQTGLPNLKIYTTTTSGGVQVFETPAKSTGQQASFPATESPADAGITVPVRQVLGEYIEVPGLFASINSAPPNAGQQPGTNTTTKVAAQSHSTGNEQNNTPDNSSPYAANPPWSTKTVV